MKSLKNRRPYRQTSHHTRRMGVGISLSGLASAVANGGGIGTETRFTIVQHNLSNINKFGGENQFTAEKALSARDSLFFIPIMV